MKCEYCKKRLGKKKCGSYQVDATRGYSIDGDWWVKEGHHLKCKELYEKISRDVNVRRALDMIRKNEM